MSHLQLLGQLGPQDQQAAVGAGVYALLARGVVDWPDVVRGHPRPGDGEGVLTLAEVVRRNSLPRAVLIGVGIKPAIAERALAAAAESDAELRRRARADLNARLRKAADALHTWSLMARAIRKLRPRPGRPRTTGRDGH